MIGYCQARDYSGHRETHIGHPWVSSDCPEEVKEKLFDDLFTYCKNRKSDYPLKMNVQNVPEKVSFASKKGFTYESGFFIHTIPLKNILQIDISDLKTKYNVRKATETDTQAVGTLYVETREPFLPQDDKELLEYMRNLISKNHVYLVEKDKELVGITNWVNQDKYDGETEKGLYETNFSLVNAKHVESIPLLLSYMLEQESVAKFSDRKIKMMTRDQDKEIHQFGMDYGTEHKNNAIKMSLN